MRRAMLGILLLILLGGSFASAQGELLQNSSLDEGSNGPYTTRRGGEFPIYLPNGWNAWLAAQSGDFYNRGDRTTMNPHPGPGPSPKDGNRALNVDCGFVTCTVAIYQQVSVTEGENIQARAWSQVKACNIAPDSDNCGSAVESGSQTRIGIDPNGGTDPNDSDIVWSNWSQPHDQWLEMSVSATTTGGTATLFLYSTQANTAQLNRTYWDAATLQGGGEGGAAESAATPRPTAPPEVPFVVPQDAGDDGSITHTVSAGDTLDSIAVAYGMSRADILALNPSITDPRIISLGQRLVIREAQGSSSANNDDDDDSSSQNADEVPSEGVNLEAEVTEEAGGAPVVTSVPGEEGESEGDTESSEDEATPTISPVTLTPAPVVAAELPASDPSTLTAAVCVILFEDSNQNRLQEPSEAMLSGGNIQLVSGTDVLDSFDSEIEPGCFDELASGSYVVSASAPEGYGLTSPNQLRLQALAGNRVNVAFGAAMGVEPVAPLPADSGDIANEIEASTTDPAASPFESIFGISGLIIFGVAGVVLAGGLVLTLFLRRR